MSNAFMVYLPALPHGKFEIERGELPWIYDQDPSSGFVATMRVVPEDDYKKLEAENEQLKTVPMRYRRLAFNAKLQDKCAELGEKCDALLADNERLREAMLAVLCDPQGVPCFRGSDGDRKVIADALAATPAQTLATKEPE